MKFNYLSTLFLMMLIVPSLAVAGEQGHAYKHMHHHDNFEVSSFEMTPTVALEVLRDDVGGWNIHVKVVNFSFAPERVNSAPAYSEGHAHLYVDGKKVARLYGSWFHLADLSSGKHTIRVSLNANNHAGLVFEGTPIAASQEIVQ